MLGTLWGYKRTIVIIRIYADGLDMHQYRGFLVEWCEGMNANTRRDPGRMDYHNVLLQQLSVLVDDHCAHYISTGYLGVLGN